MMTFEDLFNFAIENEIAFETLNKIGVLFLLRETASRDSMSVM
jgi:hypothetical protein